MKIPKRAFLIAFEISQDTGSRDFVYKNARARGRPNAIWKSAETKHVISESEVSVNYSKQIKAERAGR